MVIGEVNLTNVFMQAPSAMAILQGADHVFTGEAEVALSLIETILGRLGATAEQIDRERERAHRELFGNVPG